MRVERRILPPEKVRRIRNDVAEVVHIKCLAGRICGPTCAYKCRHCGSTSCQCSCSPDCPDAPRYLSSAPDQHPIEPAITPLVFEMKRLGLFQPCWSCEGHNNTDGSLWKLPRIWFYCDSSTHIRLLSEVLSKLAVSAKLSTPWQVAVVQFDPGNLDTTYALEPVAQTGQTMTLPSLQGDTAQIALSIRFLLSQCARRLQAQT